MNRRTAWLPSAFLLTLMATEFLDEFVGGAREAAWPLIRSDLELSYVQIGILLSVPAVVGSLLEPAIGILGDVWKRHAMVLGGGVAIALSLVLVSAAREFFVFLAALVLFYPASGAFVTLSQATLMDNDPARRGQNMARWTVVGSIGVIAGSLVLGLALLTGAGWRALFGAMAVVTLLLVLMVRHTRVGAHEPGAGESMGIVAVWQGVVAALRALRRREVLRWLLLLEFSDLLLEGFHGYLALYLVDVAGSSASTAAMGVAVWSAAVLTGGLAMVPLLGRVRGQTYLWSSAAAVLATFPMFLLVPVLGLKLVVIAMLGFASAGWYPVLQGRVYSSMPGQIGSVMAVKSASGLVGSFVPLALGVLAQHWGLQAMMWLMLASPAALLARTRIPPTAKRSRPDS